MANNRHLEIARQGKEAWNSWRESNDEDVDFTNHDFSQEDICFKGYNFYPRVLFSGSILPVNLVHLRVTNLPEEKEEEIVVRGADFRECNFGNAQFKSCYASEDVFFNKSAFLGRFVLNEAAFEGSVHFQSSTINMHALCGRAIFYGGLYFVDCSLPEGISFYRSFFGSELHFANCLVGEEVYLAECKIDSSIHIEDCHLAMLDLSYRQHRQRYSDEEFKHDGRITDEQYLKLDRYTEKCGNEIGTFIFERCSLSKGADFSGRKFTERVDMKDVVFSVPPSFHECEELDGVSFSNIKCFVNGYWKIGRWMISRPAWTTEQSVVENLRCLRKIAVERHDHDFERDIFALERLAQRGVLARRNIFEALPVILITGAYAILSSFGKSILRPILFLIVSMLAHYSYGLSKVYNSISIIFDETVFRLTLGRSFPFLPFLSDGSKQASMQLFGGREGEILLSLLDDVVAIGFSSFNLLLLFMLGLAIRNYFRIK